MRGTKPLLGFGWMGWALLPVAAALVVVLATGYDLRYQLLAAIEHTFGRGAAYWFLNYVLLGHVLQWNMQFRTDAFGLIGLCIVLTAFTVYPRKIGWWWWLLIVALGIAAPSLYLFVAGQLHATGWFPSPGFGVAPLAIAGSACLAHACVLMVLWGATRSRFVLIGYSVLGAVSFLYEWALFNAVSTSGFDSWLMGWPTHIVMWGWHPALAIVMLTWAIRERRKFERHGFCRSCGYDLRTLDVGVCPECGVAVESNGIPVPDAGGR